jgi:hypothetical protein
MRLARSQSTASTLQPSVALPRAAAEALKTTAEAEGLGNKVRAKAVAFCTKEVLVPLPAVAFGAFCVNNLIQDYLGTKDDFFYDSFVTDKNPDDIAEFYQAEDLLKIISMHPFMFSLFMDRVVVGEEPQTEEEAHLELGESRMIVQDLGMEASFTIKEEEEEIDGQMVKVDFQRHERFIDYVPFLHGEGNKILLWDQTWTFGFRRTEDGRTEVYHKGEKFYGPWPIRIIIYLHQHFVIWACKQYVCCDAFGSDEDGADDRREEILSPGIQGAVGKVLDMWGEDLDWCESQLDRTPDLLLRVANGALPERSIAQTYLKRTLSIRRQRSVAQKMAEAPKETSEDDAESEEPEPISPEKFHYAAWRSYPVLGGVQTA